jgi:hypothetical protein
MTAEDQRIFNEVDNWASQKIRRAEPARDRAIAVIRLNGHDHKAVTYTSSRASKEPKSGKE